MLKLIALLSPVIPIFILITLFKENFSFLSLIALFISIYGAMMFSSIQQGVKSLFPTILGFIILLSTYYMVISQNYWFLLIIPFSILFGRLLPEKISSSSSLGDEVSLLYQELCQLRQELLDNVGDDLSGEFQVGLREYYVNATGKEDEVSKTIVMILLKLLKTKEYNSIISFNNKNIDFIATNMDISNFIIYSVVVGGAYQELDDFERADEYYSYYLDNIVIAEEDAIENISIEQQKLLTLVGELEGFGLEYKIDKTLLTEQQISEMKSDVKKQKSSSSKKKKGKK